MLSAVVDAVEEVGYPALTVGHVINRARVSRKTFYDVFVDREHCFLEAFEQTLDQVRALALTAYESEETWRDGVRCALIRILEFMDDEPALARLLVIDSLGGGESILARRAAVLAELAGVVDIGRVEGASQGDPPDVTAEAIIGGIFAVLSNRLSEGPGCPVSSLQGQLMSMIVLPYLGARAARKELDTPVRQRSRQAVRKKFRAVDPLAGLKVRLTYRTIRVMTSIAKTPGASNRELAEASGISDQGQISKLLNRLDGLGWIENRGVGQARGGCNEWWLTPQGVDVQSAVGPV